MLLKTDRLVIRKITEMDQKALKEIWINFNNSPMSQYDVFHSTDDKDVYKEITKWTTADSNKYAFFVICLDDIVIGYSVFYIIENRCEIGYCFHSDYQKRGYAKESHIALFNYFKTLGITKFIAYTAINNIPSVSFLKSLGFKLINIIDMSFYKDDKGNDIVFKGGIFELDIID